MANQNQLKNNVFLYFLFIWLGDLISTIGSGLTAFSLAVYAFNLTGKATSSTMVVLLTFLPGFLLRPVGGVLADRMDRSKLMIIANLGSALSTGLILFLITTDSHDLFRIYPGIILCSLFFAIQNPAYKACVSDFLPKDLYVKASGLLQLSSAAQFLIAPMLAGFLLSITSIHYVLFIDCLTFFISASVVVIVKYVFKVNINAVEQKRTLFFKEMIDGAKAITADRGILILTLLVSLLLFYVGLIQSLLAPMVLSFTDARTLGTVQSICATGMLVSSLFISTVNRKNKNRVILALSVALMGIFFSFVGIFPNIWAIIVPLFLFFLTVPFANSSIDVLIRVNISHEKQGRVWSLISVITYFGALIAYLIAGFLADHIFNPMFMPDGVFANTFIGHIFGIGKGRGIAFIFFISGILVALLSILIFKSKSIMQLDQDAHQNKMMSPEDMMTERS